MSKTNLQTLTAEELTPIICDTIYPCEYCIYKTEDCPVHDAACEEGIYKWLISEAKEEE